MNIADLTITSLETISCFDISTGAHLFTMDELQNATIEQAQETVDITGKAGRKISTLKRNKTVTISGNNGMISGGLLEMQTGNEFKNTGTYVNWIDYLTVEMDSTTPVATTTYKAVGTTGAEITELLVKNDDGTAGTSLEQASEAAAGKFAYDPATKKLTFNTDVAAGTEVVVYYKRYITADVQINLSDTYSGKCSMYIDALAEDKCANVYRVQFYIPKADFDGNFSIEMGDTQVVHAFSADAMAGACGLHGVLWTYTIFGENTEDTAVPAGS